MFLIWFSLFLFLHCRRNSAKSKQKECKLDQGDFLPLSVNQENKDESDERPAKRKKEEEIEVVLSEEDKSNLPDEVAIVSESQEDEKETLQLSLEEVKNILTIECKTG